MTDYEVIHELNSLKSYTGNTNNIDKRDKAIEIAKKAVSRCAPKDVSTSKKNASIRFWQCSVCQSFVQPFMKYCCICGQALDWRNSE